MRIALLPRHLFVVFERARFGLCNHAIDDQLPIKEVAQVVAACVSEPQTLLRVGCDSHSDAGRAAAIHPRKQSAVGIVDVPVQHAANLMRVWRDHLCERVGVA